MPPAELQAEYFRLKRDRDDLRRQTEKNLIADGTNSMLSLKEWWKTDFKAQQKKYPEPDAESMVTEPLAVADMSVPAGEEMIASEDVVDEMVVSGYGMAKEKQAVMKEVSAGQSSTSGQKKNTISNADKNASQPTIKLVPIKQDNVYMKQLTGKLDEDYAVYLKLRPEYISTPVFYFDMADWFFKHNDRERALLILTSIADLELENASLFRLLGYRLKEYKEYALETYVCQKVIKWRPMEPQSYRDYALALADNGNYQAALVFREV